MPGLTLIKRRLQGHRHQGGRIEGLDLRSMDAFGSTWEDVEFHGCRMQMANLANATFVNCRLIACDLSMVNFAASRFTSSVITECQAEQSSFIGAVIRDTNITETRLCYSTFAGTTWRGFCALEGNNFHGADLTFLESDRVSFTGSNLWGAKLVMGCPVFGAGMFDERQVRQFAAMMANATIPPEIGAELRRLADDQMDPVTRLMRRTDDVDGV